MSEKIDVDGLKDLDAFLSLPKSKEKKCVIENIILEFPDSHRDIIRGIIETNKEYNYSIMEAMKILRQTNIKNGSTDTLGKHRRKNCICYV